MNDPLEHIQRPEFPWRNDCRTECGRRAVDVAVTISRDRFIAKVKDQGRQRAAMSTCMTCWSTASRWGDWNHSPADVAVREGAKGDRDLWEAELRAFALMIEAHPDEWASLLQAMRSVDQLSVSRANHRWHQDWQAQ